jgi:VWFA-related protein
MVRVLLALSLVTTAWLGRQQVGLEVFRSEVRTVSLYPTVRDPDGHLVTDLSAADFAIFDDGQPADVTVFSNAVQPLAVVIMLDMGAASRLLRLQATASAFVDQLGVGDRAAVGTIGDEVAISPSLSNDYSELKRIIHEESWPTAGGSWTVWPGVDRALARLHDDPKRKVLLLLSGGTDGDGCFMTLHEACRSLDQVRQRALRSDVMVYVVVVEGSPRDVTWRLCGAGRCPSGILLAPEPPGTMLNALSDDTGGGHFRLLDVDDAGQLMEDLANEVRHQYAIGFTPRVLDERVHKIRVNVRRSNVIVRARQSYLATRAR